MRGLGVLAIAAAFAVEGKLERQGRAGREIVRGGVVRDRKRERKKEGEIVRKSRVRCFVLGACDNGCAYAGLAHTWRPVVGGCWL